MNISVGIVGLPNVGKSTLFNALLKKQTALVANYPFATIEPNVGVVEVPDERLLVLAKVVETSKIVPAVVEFYDIAGLVAGASKGEGLGNKFLSHIREVSVIVHVVRLFEDGDIIHVSNKVDPTSDMTIIDEELALADLATLQKQHEPKGKFSKEEMYAWQVIVKVKEALNHGTPVRDQKLSDEERAALKPLNLLTAKPVIYVFNVSEAQLSDSATIYPQAAISIAMPVKLENEMVDFSQDEQKEYLSQYSLDDTGLNRLIKKAYETLGLISFLTAGVQEVRAWTIQKGTNAQNASGAIHTDFVKHFIKADIVRYEKFVENKGWVGAREVGAVTSAGRDYEMQDGDVVDFKVNV